MAVPVPQLPLPEQATERDEPTVPLSASSRPVMPQAKLGDASPWQRDDWGQAELTEFLAEEQARTRELFESQISHETPIPRSALARAPATLAFKDVTFSVRRADGTKATILEPTSGSFVGGQLVALMGPSGCGKTTLLDMLAMKKTSAYGGEVRVNGHPRDHLFRRVAAYVGQEDAMPQHWKVREAVEFNWRLKAQRQRNVPDEFQRSSLDILLAAVGLAKVADTYVGGPRVRGISGGQRRRVTLARGLAQKAAILFADEPTSGLSATDAELCVRALRIVAKKFNTLIIVVIHQPRLEVAALFDQLLLLTSNPGRVVYSGSMADAASYWKGCGLPVALYTNPTDFYLDTATPGGNLDHADELVALFGEKLKPGVEAMANAQLKQKGMTAAEMLQDEHRLHEEAKMAPAPVRAHPLAAPFFVQLRVLMRRKLSIMRRDRASIIMPILFPLLTGTLAGLMSQGVGSKALMQQLAFVFVMLTTICMGGMQLMPGIMEERTIMKYDTSEGLYGVAPFILVTAMDVLLALLGVLGELLVMFALSGFTWSYLGAILGWGVLTFFVFDSFFGFIAGMAPTIQIAQVAAVPFITIFMLFSGFMITKASAPVFLRWIFEISPIGYAIQNIFVMMSEDFGHEGETLVQQLGFERDQEVKSVLVMLAMAVLLRVLQVLALAYANNVQK